MQAWIVKHIRERLWANGDSATDQWVPPLFHCRDGAEWVKDRMQVPSDWQVVEVEITEK